MCANYFDVRACMLIRRVSVNELEVMSDQVRKRAGPLAAGGKPEPRGNGRGGQGPPKRGHKCLSCAR